MGRLEGLDAGDIDLRGLLRYLGLISAVKIRIEAGS
jgi:hypothetical protein